MTIISDMKIESASYTQDAISLKKTMIQAVINGVSMSIPLDPDNTVYAELMRQVEEGILIIEEVKEPETE